MRTIRLTAVAISVLALLPAAGARAATLEGGLATTATIGPGGGSLTATDAGGSVLTLTVPAGALAGQEQLTLTPLASPGHRGGKFIAGAALQPAGLELLAPATLTIKPARAVPLRRQAAFAYGPAGEGFGLAPLALQARRIAIPLPTLTGGAGLISVGPRGLGSVGRPSGPEAALLNELARPAYALRLARGEGHGGSTAPLQDALRRYFTRMVMPALHGARKSFPAFSTAARRALFWRAEARGLGLRSALSAQEAAMAKQLKAALRRVWRKQTRMCATQLTVDGLRRVLVLGRVAQGLGFGPSLGGGAIIEARISRCAQLPLRLTLTAPMAQYHPSSSASYLMGITSAVTLAVPMTFGQASGPESFAYGSGTVTATVTPTTWTEGPSYVGQGCSKPTLVGVPTGSAQVSGKLTLPADMFSVSAPAWTFDVTATGTDNANWTINCPQGAQPFTQSPGALEGLGVVTGTSPVRLRADALQTSFNGSADLVSGETITGYAVDRGKIALTGSGVS